MSLLAAAGLLRASYPATFDALGAATRATLDDPGAAHAWLCHLLAAHGEPLSLLAPGGVTALVATNAGLLGLLGEWGGVNCVPRKVGLRAGVQARLAGFPTHTSHETNLTFPPWLSHNPCRGVC